MGNWSISSLAQIISWCFILEGSAPQTVSCFGSAVPLAGAQIKHVSSGVSCGPNSPTHLPSKLCFPLKGEGLKVSAKEGLLLTYAQLTKSKNQELEMSRRSSLNFFSFKNTLCTFVSKLYFMLTHTHTRVRKNKNHHRCQKLTLSVSAWQTAALGFILLLWLLSFSEVKHRHTHDALCVCVCGYSD